MQTIPPSSTSASTTTPSSTTSSSSTLSSTPMRNRAAVAITVLAALLLLSLLFFGGRDSIGGKNINGDSSNFVQESSPFGLHPLQFHQRALSRSLDYPEPQQLYSIPPTKGTFKASEMFPKKLKVLITGGAGFIGSTLGLRLHKMGHDVLLLDNMMFGYWDNLVDDRTGKRFGTLIRADVLDPRIQKYFEGVDIVFHFAALSALPVCQSHPRDSMSINVGGVANVLECCRQAGITRFIFASTSAVYEDNKEPVLFENLTVTPHLLYSLSKYQAELLVTGMATTNDLDVVMLRFFNVYGPHQDFRRKSPPLTSYVVRELINKRRPIFHSDGKQKRDYVHVDDLARLATLCMTHPAAKGEVFNVASGQPISVNDIYHIVADALNMSGQAGIAPKYRDAERFWDGYPQLFSGKKPISKEILRKEVEKRTVGSYAKAEQLLGWTPKVTMEEGLREMVHYVTKSQRMSSSSSSKKVQETAWN